MTREELVLTVKSAKSPEDILKAAKENGVNDFTPEEAEKVYRRYCYSGELSDEELDVSAGGCGVSYSNTCPVCGVGTLSQTCFLQYDPNYGKRTTTLECDNCHYSYDIADYE